MRYSDRRLRWHSPTESANPDFRTIPGRSSTHEAQASGRQAHRAGDRGGRDDRQRHRPPRHREGEAPKGQGHRRGDGRYDDDGEKRIPLDVSEGDEVLYSKYGGTEIKVDGEDLLVLRESDVLAKVES